MKLYFLRHAEAADGPDDAARPLTPKGRQQSRAVGQFLEEAGVKFDAAYSSPLVRARQTAEIVLDITGLVKPDKLQLVNALLNETSERDFASWLRSMPQATQVLLSGHSPSLGARVRALLGIADEANFDFPKGAMACVRSNDGRDGSLRFFVTPKLLGVR
jgi:phosphohistidine phosphatase